MLRNLFRFTVRGRKSVERWRSQRLARACDRHGRATADFAALEQQRQAAAAKAPTDYAAALELDALMPKFIAQLPADVISGNPYLYRRTEAERFILYSVGWDEKDDGGTPGKHLFDEKEGDWVWQSLAR